MSAVVLGYDLDPDAPERAEVDAPVINLVASVLSAFTAGVPFDEADVEAREDVLKLADLVVHMVRVHDAARASGQ